jgi:pyruvate,water dikinase
MIVEEHYKKPMDMEWAFRRNDLYIVQARPETVQARKDVTVLEDYKLLEHGKVLAQGAAVGLQELAPEKPALLKTKRT